MKNILNKILKYRIIFGAFLIHCTLGSIYSFSNISIYVISYMKVIGYSNVKYKDSSWVYVLTLIFQCFFGFLGGILNDILGARISILLGGWLMCLGILLSYFTVFNFCLFLITYAVICGIGCGIVYPIPLCVIVKKYYKYKGMISGIIFIGRGISVFLLCPLQSYFLNRYNYMPDFASDMDYSDEKYFSNMDILNRVPYLFIYEGICFAILQLIGAYLISDKEDDYKTGDILTYADESNKNNLNDIYYEEKTYKKNENIKKGLFNKTLNYSDSNYNINSISISNATNDSTSTISLISFKKNNLFINKHFILIWLMIFFNWHAVFYTQVFWKIYGINYLYINDKSLSLLASIASIFNIFGRFFWGYINDLTNFRVALTFMSLLMTILTLTLTMSGFFGIITYSIWISLIFFCHAGTFSLFPSITVHTFGPKKFGPIFGLLFTARAFSSIINALISSILLSNINNFFMSIIISLSSFLTIILLFLF